MPLTNPAILQSITSATCNATTVASSTASATILAANASRKGAVVFNNSTANLYLEFGAAATTAGAAKLLPAGYYEVPFSYTGIISGIWDTANGNADVREFV